MQRLDIIVSREKNKDNKNISPESLYLFYFKIKYINSF